MQTIQPQSEMEIRWANMVKRRVRLGRQLNIMLDKLTLFNESVTGSLKDTQSIVEQVVVESTSLMHCD